MAGSVGEVPASVWHCTNNLEVWCTVDSCAARPSDEMTPMSIAAKIEGAGTGAVSVCAYSGCWEGASAVTRVNGRTLWAADDLGFSTQPDGGFTGDVTLMIIEKEGVGFVRVGGIASPLFCERRNPDDASHPDR